MAALLTVRGVWRSWRSSWIGIRILFRRGTCHIKGILRPGRYWGVRQFRRVSNRWMRRLNSQSSRVRKPRHSTYIWMLPVQGTQLSANRRSRIWVQRLAWPTCSTPWRRMRLRGIWKVRNLKGNRLCLTEKSIKRYPTRSKNHWEKQRPISVCKYSGRQSWPERKPR